MSQSGWRGIPGPYTRPPPPKTTPSIATPTQTLRIIEDLNPSKDSEWIGGGGFGSGGRPPTFWFPQPNPTTRTTGATDSIPTTPESESDFNQGDLAFIIVSMALVFLMIPGLGFFYSGLARAKNALSLIFLCLWCVAIVSIQWFVVGYSLAFSETGSFFIGNFDHIFFFGVYDAPSPVSDKIPGILFALYQGMFAAITPALIIGGAAERCRVFSLTVFILLWTTFSYDFLAYWTWNPNGWAASMGGLDFAGGTPVHIASGAGALAYALVLGKRKKAYPTEEFIPHNLSYVCLGTGLLWFGWFGFNGGSALSASIQAVNACVATNLSACSGAFTWVLLDYFRERKYSALGFCTGAVAGLVCLVFDSFCAVNLNVNVIKVCITPACGYVSPASSLAFGFIGAIFCNIAVACKRFYCFDDALDVFNVHGIGGIIGNILTGVFAEKAYSNGVGEGGGLDGNWYQVVHQLIDTVAGFFYSFIISIIILLVLRKFLRVTLPSEQAGVDIAELGENCYDFVKQVELANARHFQYDYNQQDKVEAAAGVGVDLKHPHPMGEYSPQNENQLNENQIKTGVIRIQRTSKRDVVEVLGVFELLGPGGCMS